eukprot:5348883-Amphidinium_carterae.1
MDGAAGTGARAGPGAGRPGMQKGGACLRTAGAAFIGGWALSFGCWRCAALAAAAARSMATTSAGVGLKTAHLKQRGDESVQCRQKAQRTTTTSTAGDGSAERTTGKAPAKRSQAAEAAPFRRTHPIPTHHY